MLRGAPDDATKFQKVICLGRVSRELCYRFACGSGNIFVLLRNFPLGMVTRDIRYLGNRICLHFAEDGSSTNVVGSLTRSIEMIVFSSRMAMRM